MIKKREQLNKIMSYYLNGMTSSRKGFTLIELLAVVVILLAISVVAISSISAAIERNKAKQNETKKEIIISYAKLYYESHKNSLTKVYPSGIGCISLDDLELSDSEKVDADGDNFEDYLKYTNTSNGLEFEFVSICP